MTTADHRTAGVQLAVWGMVPGETVAIRPDAAALLVSLEASSVDVGLGGRKLVLDRSTVLVAPAGARLRLASKRPGTRVAMVKFSTRLIDAVVRRYRALGLARDPLDAWLEELQVLPRTVWVHEIVHRYVFERHALGVVANDATRFLEKEILKELYFLLRDREQGADREFMGQSYSAPVERAVAWIEAHLFEPCEIPELARRAGTSESTLLRSFHRELGTRPGEYWRSRRLDEAMILLRSGRYSVLEVADQVGYENPRAFAFAFRQRFGRTPSSVLPRRPRRRAP